MSSPKCLNTLLLIIICLFCLLPSDTRAEWQDTTILMPSVIYVGQKAGILVSTGKSPGSITFQTFVEGLHQAIDDESASSYRTERTQGERYSVQIPYQASFQPPSGEPVQLTFNFTIRLGSQVKTVSESVQVKRLSPLLLGETEKPVYRVGETVRARFISVYTSPQTSRLPARKLTYDDRNKAKVEMLSEAERDELESGNFTEVYVTSPLGERVKQWLKVTPLQAANLSYQLLADAPEGVWKVTAVRSDGQEVISFSVQKYVLPRFTVSIQPPQFMSFNSNFTQYSVCAKYTNGPVMRTGVVRSRLCVCPDSHLLNDTTGDIAAKVMQSDDCPNGWFKERPCLFSDATLSSTDGCAQFNVSTRMLELTNSAYPTWNQKVHICAEVEEEGTKSTVVQCRLGTSVIDREGSLKLDLPDFYHQGLPVYGVVHLTSDKSTPISAAEVRIEVKAYMSSCFRHPAEDETDRYHFTTMIKTDDNGTAHFVSTPLVNRKEYWLHVKAVFSGRVHDRSVSFSAQGRIQYWQQLSSTSIQIWPPLPSGVSAQCPGEVRVRLLSNVALSDKTLHIHSVVRGKHLMQTIPAESDSTPGESCTDRDDELGHYRCVNGGIECVSGWTGVNCMEAVCEPACNPRGGSCLSGERCVCRDGWTGERCESCMPRIGCIHGKCDHGNDCVCDKGWVGWNCDRKEVDYESLTEDDETTSAEAVGSQVTKKPELPVIVPAVDSKRQPLYERDIRFKVDSDWGPKAEVVIFFYQQETDPQWGSEILGTSFQLNNLVNCTSQAISLQSRSQQPAVAFSRHVASPGQLITLTISASGSSGSDSNHLTDDLSGDVCYSRISDISLDNFGGDVSLINLKTFVDRVESHERNRDYGWNDGTIQGAFSKVGIKVNQPGRPLPVYRTPSPCVYYGRAGINVGVMDGEPKELDDQSMAMAYASMPAPPDTKPRLRDFFPEVWHFEVNPVRPIVTSNSSNGVTEYGVKKNLTVPDTLTSWRASAFCTTKMHGMWVGQPATLKVEMPFFIELTLPKEAKRGEILHLPVSLFVTGNAVDQDSRECLEVHVEANLNDNDWLSLGASVYSGCVCSGGKVTFLLGMMPKRLGNVNVSVEAWAISASDLCIEDSVSGTSANGVGAKAVAIGKKYEDRLRRSVLVVAEGMRLETTVGDILCLSKSDAEISRQFDIGLPKNMVPDSLRVYVTYSDEVLGAALINLDKLVRLPMGCGEQNMVLVAPNVYVLGYLKAVPRGDMRTRQRLISRIRAHIVHGYQNQLKFQHNDGSFSAFGQSDRVGSTWLTAFVLRVFSQAYKTDASLSIDWHHLFNQTSSFLLKRQQENSGCFIETGRVLHTEMQTSTGEEGEDTKHLLITAYVLSALVEVKPEASGQTPLESLNLPIKRALNCLHQKLGLTHINRLSTYNVAQLAKVLTQVDPSAAIARSMQEELKRRQVVSRHASMSMVYWRSKDNQNTSFNHALSEVNVGSDLAANVEVTSYAYLTMSLMNSTIGELLPIIRWLSSQQKSSGGFYSTQDTVLALEVIADFATRLGLSQTQTQTQTQATPTSTSPSSLVTSSSGISPLQVSVAMWPVGEQLSYRLTKETSGTVNQMAVPSITIGDEVSSVKWSLSGIDKAVGSAGCLLVQTAFIYNVDVDAVDSARRAFDLQLSLRQSTPPPKTACTESVLDICLRPSDDNQMTGMLLITVGMVTGWQAVQHSLLSQVSGKAVDSLRKVEFDSRGSVSLYFDGFSQQELADHMPGRMSNVKRCVQVTLQQTMFVESAKAAVVKAMDYYATHRQVSANYTLLSSCRAAWIDQDEDVRVNVTTEMPTGSSDVTPTTTAVKSPPTCPQCGFTTDEVDTRTDQLYQTVCSSRTPVLLIRVLSVGAEQANVTFTIITSGDYIASWNGSLGVASPVSCKCHLIVNGARLVMFGGSDLQVNAGDALVHLVSTTDKTVLVGVEEAMPVLEAAVQRWKSKEASDEVTLVPVVADVMPPQMFSWRCSRLPTILRFVKLRFM